MCNPDERKIGRIEGFSRNRARCGLKGQARVFTMRWKRHLSCVFVGKADVDHQSASKKKHGSNSNKNLGGFEFHENIK